MIAKIVRAQRTRNLRDHGWHPALAAEGALGWGERVFWGWREF
jgi:hypothetical protein